ncbi:hypothetical protein KD050_21125 [Psychrobacillus sp. INOP01]|uniref:hypothetical protein n=1 Tax=Psychrobacillus sp. INOP01 TaxID=2829187 RepID=UPI001BACD103|nr:hypothetical protein [Psychrobacillus sp. INOP01]QUG41720.1 hypothetical protein KD050_21125 [Psychrobacillus sp. INOP01]
MELISRNIKKIGIVIVALLLVMVWVIVFANANRTYSASDVLGDYADLNAENPFVDIESYDLEIEDIFTPIEIPEETKQELIESFKNAKFKRVTDVSMDTDYRVNITLNTGYAMWVDSDKKLLNLIDAYEYYRIENDSDFFEILKITTE